MMAKGKSSTVQKLRILALLPVVGLLLFIFSFEKEELLPIRVEIEKQFPAMLEVPLTEEQAPAPPKEEIQKVTPLLIVEEPDEIFDVVEQQPNPNGGMNGWNTYLAKNLRYPLEARQRGVEGTVVVVFEIHTDGSIHNVEILRGIGGGADEEAVRVVSSAPNWEPGRQRGRAVKTRMRLPIRFKLERGITPPNKTLVSEIPLTNKGLMDAVSVIGYLSNQ